jgi:hypothetical protein
MHRALFNGYFCNNIENSEERDEARFEKLHREYKKQPWTKSRSIGTGPWNFKRRKQNMVGPFQVRATPTSE